MISSNWPGDAKLQTFQDHSVSFCFLLMFANGLFAIFVDAQQDLCSIAIDGSAPETCFGFPGEIASVAMAPDGETLGVVFLDDQGNATNVIAVFPGMEASKRFTLVSPSFDGASSIEVIQADTMDFTSDNRFIVYDAFNAINFNDGSSVGLWSIYAIDLFSGSTIALTAPKLGFHTAFPSIAQTSNAHMTFDVFDIDADENTVVAVNLYTGDFQGVGLTGSSFAIPSYTGDDTEIVFSVPDADQLTLASLWWSPIGIDRISPNGASELWLADADAGAIYRHGTFSPPPEVDIGITYTASAPLSGHVATFNLEVANNGLDQATNVAWTVSVPPNISAIVSNDDGTPNCSVLANRIECQTTEINAGSSDLLEFQFTLTASSSSAEVVSSTTAFADQPDANSEDNTAIAILSEIDLNLAPTLVASIADSTVTENAPANISVSGAFDDGDNDPLTYAASGLPGSLSIGFTTGSITGTPTAADAGNTFAVTVTATDNFGASVSDSFNINVNAAPPPPPPPQSSGGGGGGGGGCTVGPSDGTIDPTLPLLMLISSVYLCRRRLNEI